MKNKYEVTYIMNGRYPITDSYATKKEAVDDMIDYMKENADVYANSGYKKMGSCYKGYSAYVHGAFGTDCYCSLRRVL